MSITIGEYLTKLQVEINEKLDRLSCDDPTRSQEATHHQPRSGITMVLTRIHFTDGSSGVFAISSPRIPPPDSFQPSTGIGWMGLRMTEEIKVRPKDRL